MANTQKAKSGLLNHAGDALMPVYRYFSHGSATPVPVVAKEVRRGTE